MNRHPIESFWVPLLVSIACLIIPMINDLPDWATVASYFIALASLIGAGFLAYQAQRSKVAAGRGGSGGSAEVIGDGSRAIGGAGGDGNGRVGGSGGDAKVVGKKSVAKGGKGGTG